MSKDKVRTLRAVCLYCGKKYIEQVKESELEGCSEEGRYLHGCCKACADKIDKTNRKEDTK